MFVNRFISQPLSCLCLIGAIMTLTSCSNFDATKFESNTKSEIIEFIDGNAGQVVSISIVDADKVYQYHLGKLTNGNTPTNQSIYEIGSITKTYTGLLVAKAILDEKVELDKDIRHYLNGHSYDNLELSNKYITLRHLITHTSGLPEDFSYTPEDIEQGRYLEKIAKYTRDNFFEDLKNVKLNSVPGESYDYSNAGTNLAAYILEGVYGKSYDVLLSENITVKSGEKFTKLRRTDFKSEELIQGLNGEGQPMPFASTYWFADGGLTTTLGSATSYIQHQLSSEPEVIASHQLLDESWTGYGSAFYWYTNNYDSNEQMLYQSGGSMGTSSWLAIYPKKEMGIFIVTNVASGDTQQELEDISDNIIKYLMAYKKVNKQSK